MFTWAFSNSSVRVQVFMPGHWFLLQFLLQRLTSLWSSDELRFPVFACLFNLGGSSLPCVLLFLLDPCRVGDFFSLLSFSLVRIKWWLPSSLYVETEIFIFFWNTEKRVSVIHFEAKYVCLQWSRWKLMFYKKWKLYMKYWVRVEYGSFLYEHLASIKVKKM